MSPPTGGASALSAKVTPATTALLAGREGSPGRAAALAVAGPGGSRQSVVVGDHGVRAPWCCFEAVGWRFRRQRVLILVCGC